MVKVLYVALKATPRLLKNEEWTDSIGEEDELKAPTAKFVSIFAEEETHTAKEEEKDGNIL